MGERLYYVYILASASRVLYTGSRTTFNGAFASTRKGAFPDSLRNTTSHS
jgi:hypothetical protein